MKRLLLMGAVTVLLGAGCITDIDLNRKFTDANPFNTESVSRAHRLEITRSIEFSDGLALTLRPTYLGVTGTVADVIGDEDGITRAVLDFADGDVLDWTRTDHRETAESSEAYFMYLAESGISIPPERRFEIVTTKGHMAFERGDDDRKMLLPAFWQEGDSTVEQNGILWLTGDAHGRLKQGQTVEWGLGLGNSTLDTASDVLRGFNETVRKLFGDDDSGSSPFDLRLVTEDGLFAVRVDGQVETVEVLQAKSWFADYLILDNPDNPLILKVGVNPVALGALDAFAPLGVDTKALGYEITEITR